MNDRFKLEEIERHGQAMVRAIQRYQENFDRTSQAYRSIEGTIDTIDEVTKMFIKLKDRIIASATKESEPKEYDGGLKRLIKVAEENCV